MKKQQEKQQEKDITAIREDGFGHQFKNTRDKNNLSIEDVSRELHLDKKMIQALENEDYAQLPAAAFVCGYIRNYARFLNIQAEPLIEYYKNNSGATTLEPKLKITKGGSTPRQPVFFSALSAIVGPLLILLVLVAGGWQAWLYISQHYLNADEATTESLVLDGMPGAETAGVDDINNTEVLLLPERVEPETSASQLAADTLTENAPIADLASIELPPESARLRDAEDALSAEKTVLIRPDDSQPAQQLEEPPLERESSDAAVSPAEEVAVIPENQLLLEFSGDSWVSIKDADDNTLAIGLKKSSKVMRLNGKVPYQVFLGDATVVKISFNGKAFDHTKYINNKKIARFKVK